MPVAERMPSRSVPDGTVKKNRKAGYRPVQKHRLGWLPVAHVCALLALISFLATPQGVWCFMWSAGLCTAFVSPATVAARPMATWALGSAITTALSVGSFIPVARCFDQIYDGNPGLRCQTDKAADVKGLFSRSEVRLAVMNLAISAVVTVGVAVWGVRWPGNLKIYLNVDEYGWPYLLGSTVAYFLIIDCWAYLGHRLLHVPALYRTFHKWHHHYKQTTAFVALGLHPCDMLILHCGVYMPMYVLPMHVSCVTANLLYVHYHNIVDHSGIYSESWLPWQPSSLFHDDHHRLFHMNYGQTLTLWDQLGGTFFEEKRRYTESTFTD